MKVVTITAKRQCRLVDRPEPRIAENVVKVRIRSAPMCAEYKFYAAGRTGGALGHEAAGDVVEVVHSGIVKVGDRVVVMPQSPCGACWLCLRGDYIHCESCVDLKQFCGTETGIDTYAESCIALDRQLVAIPESMSYDHAAMACCGLGATFGAMQHMSVTSGDTITITGMGPVGLGGVIHGVSRGARVIAVEPNTYRRALAATLGAALVIDPGGGDAAAEILEFTGGRGADKAVDCSGARAGRRLLIDTARRKGQVAFVGEGGELAVDVSDDLIRKGLTLHGSWHYNLNDVPRMMGLIAEQEDKIDELITHCFPLSRVQEAWELQLTGNCGKIILKDVPAEPVSYEEISSSSQS